VISAERNRVPVVSEDKIQLSQWFLSAEFLSYSQQMSVLPRAEISDYQLQISSLLRVEISYTGMDLRTDLPAEQLL
jgi:hypothetical protein